MDNKGLQAKGLQAKRDGGEVMGLLDKELKEIARKKRNEYMRNWRKNNPDKVKKHQETYWKKVAMEVLEQEEKARGKKH